MSDIDLVIRRSKKLEGMLREQFKVQGRGLHDLTTAAKEKGALPTPLVKKLRFIATMRNRIVHDTEVNALDDRRGFIQACDDAELLLGELAGPKDSLRLTLIVATVVVLFLIIGIVISVMLIRSHGLPLLGTA